MVTWYIPWPCQISFCYPPRYNTLKKHIFCHMCDIYVTLKYCLMFLVFWPDFKTCLLTFFVTVKLSLYYWMLHQRLERRYPCLRSGWFLLFYILVWHWHLAFMLSWSFIFQCDIYFASSAFPPSSPKDRLSADTPDFCSTPPSSPSLKLPPSPNCKYHQRFYCFI